jgi:putative membrane protein
MEVIQFLIKNFGDFGKFIALIILVLQLAASGGTFPVETIDNGFKGFTSFLPMTYTIRAFKDVLIPTDHSLLGTNTIIIIGIFAALLVLQLVIDVVKDYIAKNKVEEVKTTKKSK